MRKVINLWARLKRLLVGLYYSCIRYKDIRVFLCNDFKVGIKYVFDKKILFPHPIGIVIGKKVEIGRKCTIYQNVTLGTKDGVTYPIIGDDVTIYANSVVFGNITIGNNVIIGAGSIVNFDVPDNSVVAGNPAKIVRMK